VGNCEFAGMSVFINERRKRFATRAVTTVRGPESQ
jgi:hypothetical protein